MATSLSLTVAKIYDTLTSGKEVQIVFASKVYATNLRNKLAVYKHRTEKVLKELDVIQHESLCMNWDDDTKIATFSIQNLLKDNTKYEILRIIPHPPTQ